MQPNRNVELRWGRRSRTPSNPYDPRSQLQAVAVSTFLSLFYIFIFSEVVLENERPFSKPFVLAAIGVVGIAFVAANSGLSWATPKNWEGKLAKVAPTIRKYILYVDTFASVAVLGWATTFTGGPVHSPYAPMLVAVALVSPFVTEDLRPAIVVTLMVAVSYIGWWQYSAYQSWAEVDTPEGVEAVTALASVAIGIFLEYVRRSKEESIEQSESASAPA